MPPELERQLATSILQVGTDERLENAQRVVAHLEPYGWLDEDHWPQRPTEIAGVFDDELVKYYRQREDGQKLTKDETTALRELSRWRHAVVCIEAKLISNLQLLVATVSIFEQAHRAEQAEQVRAFIEEQYRCLLPVPCPHPWCDWTRRYVSWFAQHRVLLPLHLRKMTKPPSERPEPAQRNLYEGEGLG